ncbi:styrene monooxygenase/indole monooxygenase family protein [Nocardia brasiliensis]
MAVLEWSGHLSIPAQSVDQRTVFARWLDDYLAVGGHLEIADPTVSYVDHGAARHDLTVVTRASAELNACFPTDLRWPQVRAPLRRLSVLYLDGVTAEPEELGTYVTVVSHGEVISYAGLTGTPGHERRCEMLLFEARPGGALDLFRSDSTAGERLRLALRLLHHHLPASLSERYRGAELTDSGGTLVGAVHPSMHHPVGTLPSGALVLGGGDVVCRMDPGGAQGANSAAQCAQHYSDAISSTPAGGCFDRAWMDATAEPWLREVAHPAARWTTTVLDPPPSMQSLIFAARHDSTLADLFADTFAQPTHRSRFITDDDT